MGRREFSCGATTLVALLLVLLIAWTQIALIKAEEEGMNYLMVFQNIPKAAPFLAAQFKDEPCKKQLLAYKQDVEALMQRNNVEKPTGEMVKSTFCKMDKRCMRGIGRIFKMLFADTGGMTEKLARQYFGEKGVDLQTIDTVISGYAENVLCAEQLESKSQEL